MITVAREKLLFVVGMWRSGTTLLHGMLNQHSRVGLMFEAHPFSLWPLRDEYILPLNWLERLDFLGQTISRHGMRPESMRVRTSVREGVMAMYRLFAQAKNAEIFGEKAPDYHDKLAKLAKVFPDAKFIIIWRDPLQCCRSVFGYRHHMRQFSRRGMLRRTLFGIESMAKGVEELRRAHVAVHEVNYHALVGDPETELRSICNFLEIVFDAKMLDLTSADRASSPGLGYKIVNSTLGDREVLPSDFVAKTRRYAVLWREKYAHLGLAAVMTLEAGFGKPGKLEQWMDRTMDFGSRRLEDCRGLVLRFVPIAAWSYFRRRQFRTPLGEDLRF